MILGVLILALVKVFCVPLPGVLIHYSRGDTRLLHYTNKSFYKDIVPIASYERELTEIENIGLANRQLPYLFFILTFIPGLF
jgi:hypothetical protein